MAKKTVLLEVDDVEEKELSIVPDNLIKTIKDGKEVILEIRKPNLNDAQKANIYYSRIFKEALKNGAILKAALEKHMKEQGLWDEDKAKEVEELRKAVFEGEKALKLGGIKLSEAREIAIKMSQDRLKFNNLMTEWNSLESNTAEGQATNARFNYLFSCCLVYKDNGRPFFKNVEDYLNRSTEDEVNEWARKFAALTVGLNEDFLGSLPENKFLKEWDFVDDKYRLINKDGHLVDLEGRLINEFNQYVDNEGRLIDKEGKLIETDDIEFSPFLDDDGNKIEKIEKTVKKAEEK